MVNPVPVGGIVSVPNEAGGAGAPVLVSQIVNATWANGQQRTLDADNRINNALAQAETVPVISAPLLDTSYNVPDAPAITRDMDGKALYDSTVQTISRQIEEGFTRFQSTYFPDIEPASRAALAWLEAALRGEGMGLSPAVEAALWQRDRARMQSELLRTEREQMATWADRGFPLPPGALAHAVKTIRLSGFEQLSAQSRDIAIKTADVAVENARIAVREALNLRIAALQSAGEYVKTLILGPQTALQLATGLAGLESDFARTLTQLYSAQAQALEPKVRLQITQAELQMRTKEANNRSEVAALQSRVSLAVEAAKMCATQAAALLNGINAGVSISNGGAE
jgi:hypothetical protein